MDNLEIPNPNHFGDVGSGGGPINIINAAFIDRIDFFAGGFPAKYGDKQSSVMDVTLREGNKNKNEIVCVKCSYLCLNHLGGKKTKKY